MYGLNIHLISFRLNSQIIGSHDKVRVSITTIPDENKDSFIIDVKNIHNTHHFFTVNVTDQTKKIIFVFRKKSFIQGDPIIASTIIHANEFPTSKNTSKNTEIKRINIYEPLSNIHGSLNANEERKIYGQMQVQMNIENAFPNEAFQTKIEHNIRKIHNGEGYSQVNSFGNNENTYQNNSLFVDDGF